MRQLTDTFPALWQRLNGSQQKFLLTAYEIDKDLPHSEGLSKVFPILRWRTVGAMCGLRASESDRAAQSLSQLNLTYIVDVQNREFFLTCGHGIRELMDARRKR